MRQACAKYVRRNQMRLKNSSKKERESVEKGGERETEKAKQRFALVLKIRSSCDA